MRMNFFRKDWPQLIWVISCDHHYLQFTQSGDSLTVCFFKKGDVYTPIIILSS